MERKGCTIGEWLDVWYEVYAVPEYASKRSKSTEMPERGYRGVSRKSKAHCSQSFGCKKPCSYHWPLQPGLYAPPVRPPGSHIPLRANVPSFKRTAINRQHCRFLKQKNLLTTIGG